MSKELDISSEASRTYTYGNGAKYTILSPVSLHIIEDDRGVSHRVIDEAGVTHRPERGWVGISWLPKPGQPAFVA
jgi:hypothetical protein